MVQVKGFTATIWMAQIDLPGTTRRLVHDSRLNGKRRHHMVVGGDNYLIKALIPADLHACSIGLEITPSCRARHIAIRDGVNQNSFIEMMALVRLTRLSGYWAWDRPRL